MLFVTSYNSESSAERFLIMEILMMKSLIAEQQYFNPIKSSSDSMYVIWWSEDWYMKE